MLTTGKTSERISELMVRKLATGSTLSEREWRIVLTTILFTALGDLIIIHVLLSLGVKI